VLLLRGGSLGRAEASTQPHAATIGRAVDPEARSTSSLWRVRSAAWLVRVTATAGPAARLLAHRDILPASLPALEPSYARGFIE
jgi:hypothetical protein